jgi:riboflavin biosynthesis pyrimidine reductase
VLAVVSASLDLDPSSSVFRDAPVRPVVVTSEAASAAARSRAASVADVIVCGEDRVDTAAMVRALADRGLERIHSEGGPHLFGAMIAERSVDELCLTLSPQLEGGTDVRIASGEQPPAALGMRLAHVLACGDELLLRYVRAR